ncbi:MAG: tRNA (adenosine(37)-N6)-threonylcarbamoyltransferase complex transferase subunit TsaD [Balneolaceae bacterium]|nr:tRNA (adenosine(37)-N6)-threonylcarbamoyltransferase complex transferase subunit TsaD [Balneolaceae bacterium]MDR9446566.1 tRNA (adenosine(37)-N6)-threonylcarbamoyltransferase complex transferase subunit TsaD [Balneolaceae bacterium]
MNILGIESSCDDTAAAVSRGVSLLSNVRSSQLGHQAFGGVVPEMASRAHDQAITSVVERALADAGVAIEELDRIAVTLGPGLMGSLLVGLSFAKGLAAQTGHPLIGVDHLEAHKMAAWVDVEDQDIPYPYVALIVSGGHTRLEYISGPSEEDNRLLGETRDDAAGEAFDKIGKMMGLGYPAGPTVDALAQLGDPTRFSFPQSMLDQPYEFSFSGLKTHLRRFLEEHYGVVSDLDQDDINQRLGEELPDLAAGINVAITEVLRKKALEACQQTGARTLVVAGGVSANRRLRETFASSCDEHGIDLHIPSIELCTDNGGMICRQAYHLTHRDQQYVPLEPYARQWMRSTR